MASAETNTAAIRCFVLSCGRRQRDRNWSLQVRIAWTSFGFDGAEEEELAVGSELSGVVETFSSNEAASSSAQTELGDKTAMQKTERSANQQGR